MVHPSSSLVSYYDFFAPSFSQQFMFSQWPCGVSSIPFIFFFSFSVILYYFFILSNSSLNMHLWSLHVQHLFVLSCTICCFLPSPNSSSLSKPPLPPSHTHTPCLPPHFPHLLPSDLGQIVLANYVGVKSEIWLACCTGCTGFAMQDNAFGVKVQKITVKYWDIRIVS